MTQVANIVVGPEDHGRRMTLSAFEHAEATQGRLYELSRGVIVVTDVPNPPHRRIVSYLRDRLGAYRLAHPDLLAEVLGGAECKLLIDPTQSERHPDIACYKTTVEGEDSSVWSIWIPELVFEVVSPESVDRDYKEKADDYFVLGVREYVVVDRIEKRFRVHARRSGKWKVHDLTAGTYSTPLLPGFEVDVVAVLTA